MVSRKTAFGSVKEKKRKTSSGIKLKRSFDYASLPDAIVDGKLVEGFAPGAQIVVVRQLDSKTQACLCEVKSIEQEKDTQYVSTWDMTLERFLCFRVSELAASNWVVKLKSLPAQST